jgi:hypothetical protein
MLEDLLTELETFAEDFRQPRIKEIAEEIRDRLQSLTIPSLVELEAEEVIPAQAP